MKMKLFALAAIGALALAACNGSSKSDSTATTVAETVKNETEAPRSRTEIYTGVLPAADADGVEYTLTLKYKGDKGGDYTLVQVYQDKDKTRFTNQGSFSLEQKDGKSYLKLTDSQDKTFVQYFLVDSPSKITMTGEDLQKPASGLNYTLTLK